MSPSRALFLFATVFSVAVVAVGFEVLKPRAPDPLPSLPGAHPPVSAAKRDAARPGRQDDDISVPGLASPTPSENSAEPVQEELGNAYDSLDAITEGNYDQRPLPRVHRPRRPSAEALKHILEED